MKKDSEEARNEQSFNKTFPLQGLYLAFFILQRENIYITRHGNVARLIYANFYLAFIEYKVIS